MDISESSQPAKPQRSIAGKIYDILSGFGLATILLVILGLLTWFATLEQIDSGLQPTLQKYFDPSSFFLLPEINGKTVWLPLPGGYWTCALLVVNLVLGGLVRIRKGWRHYGNLIAHFGIVFMLVAGGVSQHFTERGNMPLEENQTSDVAEDYYEYVVEVAEIKDDMPTDIHVILGKDLVDLTGGAIRKFELPRFPFSLELTGYMENAVPVSIGERPPSGGQRVVDGYYLAEKPEGKTREPAEQFTAACYGRTIDPDGTKSDPFILWGGQYYPLTVRRGDRIFTVSMHKRLWPVPFKIRLNQFSADFHPGTSRPSKFVSKVTRLENGTTVDQTIQMNEPMRHDGLTIYQASYGPQNARPGDKMFSVFEVVRNPADQWPQLSLWIVAFGLLVTFTIKLGSFLSRGNRNKSQ